MGPVLGLGETALGLGEGVALRAEARGLLLEGAAFGGQRVALAAQPVPFGEPLLEPRGERARAGLRARTRFDDRQHAARGVVLRPEERSRGGCGARGSSPESTIAVTSSPLANRPDSTAGISWSSSTRSPMTMAWSPTCLKAA